MAEVALEDIGGGLCETTAATKTKLYYAPLSYFTTIEKPGAMCGDTPATDLSELGSIATDHVFADTKGFHKIEVVPETGAITHAILGPRGGKVFQNNFTFLVKGSDAKTLGFARRIKNERLIILAEEFDTGKLRQLGSAAYGAELQELTGGVEATVEGEKAITFNFQDKQLAPAPIYEGAIVEFGATVP